VTGPVTGEPVPGPRAADASGTVPPGPSGATSSGTPPRAT